ncbi:MAG TPA: GNAT family N-acetyltransferase [Acidimicrobiia bacterium]|nr:GNAT family N-acetyltransferase [Acidimicrobiia bacterium]
MTEPGSDELPARAPSRPTPPPGSGLSPLYVAARTSEVILKDGSRVLIRPGLPTDRALLAREFERLSPESRYRRFFTPMKAMSESLLDYLTSMDYVNHFAWAALSAEPGPDGQPMGAGVSRYIRLKDPTAAEMAVTVVDDWQGRGLGRVLLDALVVEALENGITRFEGDVLMENRPMHEMLRRTGATFRPEGGGVLRFSIDLPAREEALGGSPFAELLRALARGEASLYQHEPCPWAGRCLPAGSGLQGE